MRFTPQIEELINIRHADRGRPLSDLTHRLGYTELQADAQRVLNRLVPVEREVRSENDRWYLTRVLPYRAVDDRIQGVVITLIDITDRKHASDILEERVQERTEALHHQTLRLQRLAQELITVEQRERKRLAAILHDDLQQHLVAAKMHLERVDSRSRIQSGKSALAEGLEMLDQALTSTRDLTLQLRPPVLFEDGLVPALRWLGEYMHKHFGLSVTMETDTELVHLSEDVRFMLFESVRELLFNVVKHSGTRQTKVELQHDTHFLRISVSDRGIGFDPDAKPVMDRMSSGLGLFSIHERLAAAGGSMRIHAAPRDGVQVLLQVPNTASTQTLPQMIALEPIPADSSRDSSPPAGRRSRRRKLRVLVVEDHAMVREGIVVRLRRDRRVQVVGEATDGLKALTAVQQYQPDVVLMDVNMPKMNGIETCREIRRRWPHVHVVGLSIQDDPATEASMRDAGACAFVSKTREAQVLVETILNAVPKT